MSGSFAASNASLKSILSSDLRWRGVDLEAVIEEGKGVNNCIVQKFKCSKCGDIAEKQNYWLT